MSSAIESPFRKLLANPFGAGLMLLKPAAYAIAILAIARIVLASSYPPAGTLVAIPMYFVGNLAQRYNKGLFMGNKKPYDYPNFVGNLKGGLLAGLGFGTLALSLFIATVPF